MGILKNLLVTGSARFVNVIKGTVQKSQNGAYYGTCTTAAATAEKVVVLTDGAEFELIPGVVIGVKFSYTNTADNAKLNVNSTGAKSIWYNTAVYTGHSGDITGYANRIFYYMYDGTNWVFINNTVNCTNNSNTIPSAQCETAADTAAKAAACTNYTLTDNTYLHFNIRYANTSAAAITMNVNSKGAKPIYINGVASSSSNYTLPAGSYIAFYDGTNWYFRTDGKLPAKIDGDAATVNGHSVAKDVPSNAVFTDTTALTSMTGTLGVGHGGTGATSASAAKTNLGILSTFNVKSFVAASNTTTTLTVTSNSRVAIYAFSYAALCEFLISSTSTGDVSHSKIGTAASISISATGTNSVTFNNTGNSVQLYAIIFLGDVSS